MEIVNVPAIENKIKSKLGDFLGSIYAYKVHVKNAEYWFLKVIYRVGNSTKTWNFDIAFDDPFTVEYAVLEIEQEISRRI